MMNSLRCALILLAGLWLLPPGWAAKPKTAPMASDPEYVAALAAANRFLHAWQVQDHETGVLMLTDAAKRQTSEDHLERFFSPAQSTEEGFEITRGKKLTNGRYAFPVALWQTALGKDRKLHPRYSEIVVVRTGKDEWAIDKLP
jgi:hypothetical protein